MHGKCQSWRGSAGVQAKEFGAEILSCTGRASARTHQHVPAKKIPRLWMQSDQSPAHQCCLLSHETEIAGTHSAAPRRISRIILTWLAHESRRNDAPGEQSLFGASEKFATELPSISRSVQAYLPSETDQVRKAAQIGRIGNAQAASSRNLRRLDAATRKANAGPSTPISINTFRQR